MTRSANEIETMVVKACRGARIPLAQAQDVGRTAAIEPRCIAAILDHLKRDQIAVGVTTDTGVTISCTHALRDGPVAMDAVTFGAEFALLCDLVLDDFLVNLARRYGVTLAQTDRGVRVTPGGGRAELPKKRAVVPDVQWQALNAFATKTYVPETETSRLAGAGAGLTDND